MNDVWSVTEQGFNELALDLFHYQAKNNPVYAQYLALIDKSPSAVHQVQDIPFLPIVLFKEHQVLCADRSVETIFESSSTTGIGISKHAISSLDEYQANAQKIFSQLVGDLSDFEVLGLLPNYLERQNSSLVYMVDRFMELSQTAQPAYFLYDHEELAKRIASSNKKVLLFGVSFALLDFVESHRIEQPISIIETGGMKGRKKEWIKSEVHAAIQTGFPNAHIMSEYGMTELSSQAYALDGIHFNSPSWMKVSCRTDSDPLSSATQGVRGALNIIDLANVHSCAFIATDDLGIVHPNNSFEVLGRLDHSDLRGCSLMVS